MKWNVILTAALMSGFLILSAPAADAPQTPVQSIDRETLNRMVQEEVQRQLPAAVKAEVARKFEEVIRQTELRDRLNASLSLLQTLRGELELYSIQHDDRFPALSELTNWKALLEKTDSQGHYEGHFAGKTIVGPYLDEVRPSPLTGHSKVVASGTASPADGFTWDAATGTLRLVVPTGDPELIKALSKKDFEVVEPVNPQNQRKAQSVMSTLQTLRGQIILYEIQHSDQHPTMAQMSNWNVLLSKTDGQGNTAGPKAEYGPYIAFAPPNPINGKSGIADANSIKDDTGWVYDEKTGELKAFVPAGLTDAIRGYSQNEFVIGK